MTEASDDAQRETIREQLAVKLRRRLKKLTDEARQQFEAVAGENARSHVAAHIVRRCSRPCAWLKDRAAIGPILDWEADGRQSPLCADLSS